MPGRIWYVLSGDITVPVLESVLRREADLRRQPHRRDDGVPEPMFYDHAEHVLRHNI